MNDASLNVQQVNNVVANAKQINDIDPTFIKNIPMEVLISKVDSIESPKAKLEGEDAFWDIEIENTPRLTRFQAAVITLHTGVKFSTFKDTVALAEFLLDRKTTAEDWVSAEFNELMKKLTLPMALWIIGAGLSEVHESIDIADYTYTQHILANDFTIFNKE